jgi:hypothetical protein
MSDDDLETKLAQNVLLLMPGASRLEWYMYLPRETDLSKVKKTPTLVLFSCFAAMSSIYDAGVLYSVEQVC